MLLDLHGKNNHIKVTIKTDPHSSSFIKPDEEMNIASGYSHFVIHSTLENAKYPYIKGDNLFLNVSIELTVLEDF
jgi:hypothetical protein